MKFRLLLLDANVVIYLHELGLWNTLIESCNVTLTPAIMDESKFWEDEQGRHHPIELQTDIQTGRIRCEDVPFSTIQQFLAKYGSVYLDRLDPGEAEALAFLMQSTEAWLIASADEIVYKTLGREGRSEQGISLEEILQKIGRSYPNLRYPFTRQFRENVTRKGQIDNITGFGHSDDQS